MIHTCDVFPSEKIIVSYILPTFKLALGLPFLGRCLKNPWAL